MEQWMNEQQWTHNGAGAFVSETELLRFNTSGSKLQAVSLVDLTSLGKRVRIQGAHQSELLP